MAEAHPLTYIYKDLLTNNGKTKFLIPSYQRGYKWKSSKPTDQVNVLMDDLFKAFLLPGDAKYYLQFITIKERGDQFEVIDGQQRLTTLTVLFSVISFITNEPNISSGVLCYETRQNFVERFIDNNIRAVLEAEDWPTFVKESDDSKIDNQDVWHLFNASRAIYAFVSRKPVSEKLDPFYNFLSSDVRIIVNEMSGNTTSERIFINVNKGVKLQDEELVKGLLITKVPLEIKLKQQREPSELEISEMRANLGRQWDDLSHWAVRPEIHSYFKTGGSANQPLSWLIGLIVEGASLNQTNPVYHHLDSQIRSGTQTATELFDGIKKTHKILSNWYSIPEYYNLFGFLLHQRRKQLDLRKLLSELKSITSRDQVLVRLKTHFRETLPIDSEGKLLDLHYGTNNYELFTLFLALDVAKFLPMGNQSGSNLASSFYNFGKIVHENWTIEHIFPQNAKGLGSKMLDRRSLDILKELLPEGMVEVEADDNVPEEVFVEVLDGIRTATNELVMKGKLYEEALGILLSKNMPSLHRLGNLALLDQSMNSSFSNDFFNSKRSTLVLKLSQGRFVPAHTYDVFSKLVVRTNTGLHTWSKSDIEAHESYINTRVNQLLNYLTA